VVAPDLAEVRAPLRRLLHLHYRLRFDPQGLDSAERDELRHEASACLYQLLKAEQAAAPRG
jgi:hypothetical protein